MSNEYHKEYYRSRRATGLCVRCQKRPPKDGMTLCEGCAERQRIYQREHYKKSHSTPGKKGRKPRLYAVTFNGFEVMRGTKAEIGAFFGVSVQTVGDWTRRGGFFHLFTIAQVPI